MGSDLLALVNLTEGDFEIGIWLCGRRDNIRVINRTQQRKDDIFSQEGSLAGDTYFRVPGASNVFSTQRPETVDAFDPREFLVVGIYTRDSFDSDARYLGVKSRFQTASQLEFRLDGWRFIKPIIPTNADVLIDKPERNIRIQLVKNQRIVSYAQRKNLALRLDNIHNL